MDMKEATVILWEEKLQDLRIKGVFICPLMIAEPGRFPAPICACDIPSTRILFLTTSGEEVFCVQEGTCLPRRAFPDRIQDESCPTLQLHLKKKS